MLRYKCGLWGIEFQPNLNYLLICLWEKCRSLFLVMYFTKAYYTYHVSKYRLEYFAVFQLYTIYALWFILVELTKYYLSISGQRFLKSYQNTEIQFKFRSIYGRFCYAFYLSFENSFWKMTSHQKNMWSLLHFLIPFHFHILE